MNNDNTLEKEYDIPHINVIICTPGYSMLGDYVTSLLHTSSVLNEKGITWTFSNMFSSHVGDSREITLNGSFQNNVFDSRPLQGRVTYDKIFWIDSDIKWTPEDFLKLYESDKDIISGAYLLSNGEVTVYPEPLKGPLTFDQVRDMEEPIKVHSVGFGFLCVKQGVFESMKRPWFQSVEATTSFEGKDFTFNIMGEDISWCHNVNNLGYDVWFDPTVRVTHHKTMKLTWEGIKP